jgi:GDP-L-fucose synthase
MAILVAGATGLAGSAISRRLKESGHNVIEVNSSVVDLRDRSATFEFLHSVKPDVVIDAAAKVGGIGANNSLPVDFLSVNLQIQTNLMDAAHSANVERFIFLGSSCIYPRNCPQPIKEEYLLTGPLEETNSAYALAKIAGLELIRSYRKQFGRKWVSLMPTNLYGPGDNFNLEVAHVLAALVNRFVSASLAGITEVTLWGSGTPRREFLHVDDLATAVEVVLEKYDDSIHLNVGTGVDLTIKELAEVVASISGYSGKILWDSSKPDGTPRKILEISRISALGWSPTITLEQGIREVVEYFKNSETVRR